jgi:hypothetical protein
MYRRGTIEGLGSLATRHCLVPEPARIRKAGPIQRATPAIHRPQKGETAMFFFSEGFTFRNFLADAFAVFMFVLWFWLLVIVIGDLFRRHDISGWGKAIWVIALIVFPYISIFAYMITQSTGMAERSAQQAQQTRENLRQVVGYSIADEIEKLNRLKKSGSITDQEFARLRAKLVQ